MIKTRRRFFWLSVGKLILGGIAISTATSVVTDGTIATLCIAMAVGTAAIWLIVLAIDDLMTQTGEQR